jgi:hypothetical protein
MLMCYDLVSVHLIAQVCTAAGNMLAGNTLRESQPCMMRFFSTHIAAGEFDPTQDVVSQLEALNDRQPLPSLDFNALSKFIEWQVQAATRRDDKLRIKGWTIIMYIFKFIEQLI